MKSAEWRLSWGLWRQSARSTWPRWVLVDVEFSLNQSSSSLTNQVRKGHAAAAHSLPQTAMQSSALRREIHEAEEQLALMLGLAEQVSEWSPSLNTALTSGFNQLFGPVGPVAGAGGTGGCCSSCAACCTPQPGHLGEGRPWQARPGRRCCSGRAPQPAPQGLSETMAGVLT